MLRPKNYNAYFGRSKRIKNITTFSTKGHDKLVFFHQTKSLCENIACILSWCITVKKL